MESGWRSNLSGAFSSAIPFFPNNFSVVQEYVMETLDGEKIKNYEQDQIIRKFAREDNSAWDESFCQEERWDFLAQIL